MGMYLLFGIGVVLLVMGIIETINAYINNGHIFNLYWMKGFITTMLGLFLFSIYYQFDFMGWINEWLPMYIFYGR